MSLEELQEQIERYYIDIENELLLNIADKLSKGKPMEIDKWDLKKGAPIQGSGGVNEWQLERLKELGGLTEENIKIISKYSGKTEKDVEKIFNRAREIGTEIDKEILDLGIKAGILNEINPQLEDIIVKSLLSNAIRDTLTTFNQQNNSLLASAGDSYKSIVNKVSSQVIAGTKTTAKAMQEAVSELAQRGLTGFIAKNGAEWTPEAYTKMVIRSNTQNTINRIQEERMQLSGNDYVEISSHIGARPLCSEDQGKIFSLSGNTTPIKDGLGHSIKVYDWNNSSYGEPAGILGINCGHSRYAFVPNISIHRKKNFTKKENDDAYTEKQKQRQYERNIRNKKREIEMLKKTNAETEYIKRKTNQLSDYRMQYLDFLKKTGRTRVSSNEWIGNNKIVSKSNRHSYKKLTFSEIESRQNSSNKAYKKFNPSEREAIDAYSMGAYQDINDYLNGKYPDYKIGKEITKDIDNAILKYDLVDDVITYRGTSKKYYSELKVGDEFSLKMYCITSLNENIAKTFMEDKKNAIMLEIRVPKGTPSLYVGDNGAYEFEAELLLGRNLNYKVIDIVNDKIILEVIK